MVTRNQSPRVKSGFWPSARHFTEAIQCPSVCFSNHQLRTMLPAVDRLGMPLVTSGQFAYVYKLKSENGGPDFAVRCFRGYLGDRDQRYRAILHHLRSNPVPYLSDFSYEPEGILVGGNRYPILSMNWIDGPTLDLYLDKMIGRREVLLHLADEWLRLIRALHEAGIAHGDLQHGNIIVEHGKLCLIDHDGMFVPGMKGWTSSEVGHQHFQHPRRDAEFFDSSLDNFSSIVVYLTLLSLAERPSLWSEYHDENLIFSRTDFIDPASSTLFGRIKEIGPEHRRLTETLEKAALDSPSSVPSLLDLVTVRSALPSWMTAPAELEAHTRTREVAHAKVIAAHDVQWVPWQAKRPASSVPATPSSSTVQLLFGPPTGPVNLPPGIRDPSAILINTIVFARQLLVSTFVWWYWSIWLLFKVVDFEFISSLLISFFCLASACLTYGFVRAQQLARTALQANSPLPKVTPASRHAWIRSAPAPVSITVPEPIVGNVSLSIYHREDCDWVKQISPRNLISFSSTSAAAAAGFKACQVCLHLNSNF